MKTLAIVVTYKNPALLEQCLSSLAGEECATFVVDNSDDNRLYTKAANLGIKEAQDQGFEYALIVCDDVLVGEGCVAKLEQFLEATPKAAIASPVQVSKAGEVTCGGCTVAFPYGRHIVAPLTHEVYKAPYEQFWANGACFLLRLSAVRECGLLDEGMKFICSDADYSFTIRARGWQAWMVPDARVTHEPNGALYTKNKFLEQIKDQDALFFMEKWITGGIFRELSSEGKEITAEDVNKQYQTLQMRLQYGYPEET